MLWKEQMSNVKYTITFKFNNVAEYDLDPHDFLDYDTIPALELAIENRIKDNRLHKPSIIKTKLEISDSFMDEWKTLVGFIPNNVMTERKRDKVISKEGVYVEEYSGFYLNNCNWDNKDFCFGDYNKFRFNDNEDYKCWISPSLDYAYEDLILFCEVI